MKKLSGKLKKIKRIVERKLKCSAHNIDHTMRVYDLCLRLSKNENINKDILRAAALLHDIARTKEDDDNAGKTDHALLGAKMSVSILKKLGFNKKQIRNVQHCIITHRYRAERKPVTKEAKILFDADKLDSLGAIGVARSLIWVGRNNAKLYTDTKDIGKYIKNNLGKRINGRIQKKSLHSPQIEFETKIKHIIAKLYTKEGKKIGKERLSYYRNFLNRLEKEIKGSL